MVNTNDINTEVKYLKLVGDRLRDKGMKATVKNLKNELENPQFVLEDKDLESKFIGEIKEFLNLIG